MLLLKIRFKSKRRKKYIQSAKHIKINEFIPKGTLHIDTPRILSIWNFRFRIIYAQRALHRAIGTTCQAPAELKFRAIIRNPSIDDGNSSRETATGIIRFY